MRQVADEDLWTCILSNLKESIYLWLTSAQDYYKM